MVSPPDRIVCLSDETTETLYLLEEDWRIVGISGFTVRPPQARHEKQIISGFTHADVRKIVTLRPDLVLGFSDLQGPIAAELIARGLEVHIFNQRSVAGILQMIRTLGALVGCQDKAMMLTKHLGDGLNQLREQQAAGKRPRVYFEEWHDPLITGIGWVSELIEIAGGCDIFPELAAHSLASQRIIADPMEVVRRDPEIVFASWCGKPFRAEQLRARPGWRNMTALVRNELHEIDSSLVLQPGPAALTDGVHELAQRITAWRNSHASRA